MNKSVVVAAILSVCCLSAVAGWAQTPPASAPAPDVGGPDAVWRNASKTPDERARDLLPRLTLQEKVALLHADGTFTSPGLPRFGIGKMWMSDGPQGVREEIQPSGWNPAGWDNDFATALPAGVSLAATWDPELGKAFGNVIGEEAAMRKKNIMLCPGMNIMRTPLNGRNSEYLGEDPYLAGRMAVGFVTGLQQNGVAACAKHYALNNQETNRGSVNVKVDERTMREIYLPAFKAAVTEGHAWAVMSAYNRVNGQYCSENDFLLNQVLKKDWGFQGLVMTDWGGTHSTVNAINNGLDLEMGSNVTGNHNNDYLGAPLLRELAAAEPRVAMSRVDDAVLRNLRVMIATGLANPPQQLTAEDQTQMALMSPAHLATARSVVEAGCVLLKNEGGVLPVDAGKVKTIAVIGDIAQSLFAKNGDSAGIKTKNEVSILAGIQKRAGAGIKVNFVQGYAAPAAGRGGFGGRGPGGPAASAPTSAAGAANPLIDAAVAAAKEADVVIVAAGLYRAQDQEGRDRPNMDLPAAQNDLIKAVAKANPKTVVVMTGGSPSVVSPWVNDVGGLVMYWYGGTEGGNGLARVLFGDVNPSGHLPCSWPKQLADSPAHNPNSPNVYPGPGGAGGFGRGAPPAAAGPTADGEDYAEGLLVGYRWFDAKKIEPQFSFGYGLSYTTFAYSDLAAVEFSASAGSAYLLHLVVSNTGRREGATVAQAYVSQNNPVVQRPPKELKTFSKITLKPGEKANVTLRMPPAALTHYDSDKHAWIAEPGDYTVFVGDSSGHAPLTTTIRLAESIIIKEGQ
jgi:beta-glucosidase